MAEWYIIWLNQISTSYGMQPAYIRENHYEKYYCDAVVIKLVLGGVQYGYFLTLRQFSDLNYSAFGPGKLKK